MLNHFTVPVAMMIPFTVNEVEDDEREIFRHVRPLGRSQSVDRPDRLGLLRKQLHTSATIAPSSRQAQGR